MPKQMVEIDVPEGYEILRFGAPKRDELMLVNSETGLVKACPFGDMTCGYPILKKIRVSLHNFYKSAIDYHDSYPDLRYGQAMYNRLKVVRSELADKINGTNCDPFQCKRTDDPQFERFVEFIESNWEH